jgi:hypothetical protein
MVKMTTEEAIAISKNFHDKCFARYFVDLTRPLTKRGDWSYWRGKTIFVKYTWKHKIRLLIGIQGRMQTGEYVFKRVKYGARFHRFLNHFLRSNRLGKRRRR